MARPVFSVVLASLTNVAITGTQIGPPPAGDTWVVRDMVAVNTQDWFHALGGMQVQDELGTQLWWIAGPSSWGGHQLHWEGRQVVDPGGHLVASAQEIGWNLRISGYQLTAT